MIIFADPLGRSRRHAGTDTKVSSRRPVSYSDHTKGWEFNQCKSLHTCASRVMVCGQTNSTKETKQIQLCHVFSYMVDCTAGYQTRYPGSPYTKQ